MIGLFIIGVILWIIGSLMEKHELAERRRRLYHLEPRDNKRPGDFR
jgi:hypothetical protein